jgi:hypothetical protein
MQVVASRDEITHPIRCFLAVHGDWMAHLLSRKVALCSGRLFKLILSSGRGGEAAQPRGSRRTD